MTQDRIVLLAMGLALLVLGTALTASESVRRWGLSRGGGRIWTSLLGEDRALKLTKYFFGPLVLVFGILSIVGALVASPAPVASAGSSSAAQP